MSNNKKLIVKAKNFTFGENDAPLELECGDVLAPVTISYETYGKLNKKKNNAVLILHALTGDAHVAGYYSENDEKPGWWNDMVGPGKAFDTDRYFIVCTNVIGGCSGSTGPRSINPETGKMYNMDFPFITIVDMVKAQKSLMDELKIEKWLSVSGGSMGGMQALQWAVSYPEFVGSVIPIATTARLSPQGIAFNWVGRESIMSDKNWNDGNYLNEKIPEKGLSTARMLAHITYLSEESMHRKFGRNLQELKEYSFDFSKNFAVESYLQYQGYRFVERFDANSYLYITRAMDYYDLASEADGDLTKAFAGLNMPFLVISFSSDWLFLPEQSKQIVHSLQKNDIDVSYCNIQSSYGHDAFLLEIDILQELISNFLKNRFEEVN